jgi:hypothetical protein
MENELQQWLDFFHGEGYQDAARSSIPKTSQTISPKPSI